MLEDVIQNSNRWFDIKDLLNEEWKDIEEYYHLYQVSNYGRIKSLDRYVSKGHHYLPRILKCSYDKDGYAIVSLSKNNIKKQYRIHQLVGKYFVPNPNNKPIFDHIKMVTPTYCDNRYTNLRPATYSENIKYSYKNGRKPNLNGLGKFGADNPSSVKVIQYDLNMNKLKVWDSFADITRECGFSHGNLVSCCKDRYKQAYGYIWKYYKEMENE